LLKATAYLSALYWYPVAASQSILIAPLCKFAETVRLVGSPIPLANVVVVVVAKLPVEVESSYCQYKVSSKDKSDNVTSNFVINLSVFSATAL